MEVWCKHVLVLGFNSKHYDLNLIRQYFVDKLAEAKVCVAKKNTKIMFLMTEVFKFLDFLNYLGPGVSYDKRVKAYSSTANKAWYEWFDSVAGQSTNISNPGSKATMCS